MKIDNSQVIKRVMLKDSAGHEVKVCYRRLEDDRVGFLINLPVADSVGIMPDLASAEFEVRRQLGLPLAPRPTTKSTPPKTIPAPAQTPVEPVFLEIDWSQVK